MLGGNLKRIRLEKGLSIRELQRMSGVSHTIIMNIESGKSKNPTIISIMKLAKTLDVTIDELIYGKKEKKCSPGTLFIMSGVDIYGV